MSQNNNAIVVSNNTLQVSANDGSLQYRSFNVESFDDKVKLYNALMNPQEKLIKHINKTVAIADVVMESVQLVNEETGEVENAPRTVIFDSEGVTYQATSLGVYSSMRRLVDIFGAPSTWEKPIKVVPVQQDTRDGNNKVLILEIADKQ